MKAAYFGIDGLRSCLALLEQRGWEITAIFTIKDNDYDHSLRICQFAKARGIPLHTDRATPEDIRELERAGVTLSVTAGYPWKIPLSDTIMQVNLHPAYLPVGRGPWPMPVSILKNIPSGMTLHKLAAELDQGGHSAPGGNPSGPGGEPGKPLRKDRRSRPQAPGGVPEQSGRILEERESPDRGGILA